MDPPRDPTLDTLLDLDAQVLVVDPAGRHWVRFVVKRVPDSPEKPHRLDYSLTLHGPAASGWWDLTTPIQSGGKSAGNRRITGTGCGQ